MSDFTITERTEPFTIDEVFEFIEDSSLSTLDVCELKSRIVDAIQAERNKAIDEFAERLKDSMVNNYRHLITTDSDGFDWITTDAVHTHIYEIAEMMKGGAIDG